MGNTYNNNCNNPKEGSDLPWTHAVGRPLVLVISKICLRHRANEPETAPLFPYYSTARPGGSSRPTSGKGGRFHGETGTHRTVQHQHHVCGECLLAGHRAGGRRCFPLSERTAATELAVGAVPCPEAGVPGMEGLTARSYCGPNLYVSVCVRRRKKHDP